MVARVRSRFLDAARCRHYSEPIRRLLLNPDQTERSTLGYGCERVAGSRRALDKVGVDDEDADWSVLARSSVFFGGVWPRGAEPAWLKLTPCPASRSSP